MVHTISFQTFFVWALLLIVHTWNSSPLRSNLLRLQCTCCTVPTTSGRPHGSPLVWACRNALANKQTIKHISFFRFTFSTYILLDPSHFFSHIYLFINLYMVISNFHIFGLAVRVFANGPGDLGSIPGRVIPKTQKMVLDTSLLNTQHYKVRIKGKVEKSREGVAPSPTPWCSSYRKGSLRVTLDYGRQLYLLLVSSYLSIYLSIHSCLIVSQIKIC